MTESWRQPLLGISSKDFENRQNISNPEALYGSAWRFKNDQDFQPRPSPTQERPTPPPVSMSTSDKIEPQAVQPEEPKVSNVAVPPEETPPEAPSAPSPVANETKEPALTRNYLMGLSKDKLKEIASGAGVANLNLGRDKLIESILDKTAS